MADISNPTIHPIIISDQSCPNQLHNAKKHKLKSTQGGDLIQPYLKDKEFEWKVFMETNDSANTSHTLIWETGKVVLGGKIISYSTYTVNKRMNKK